MKVACAVPRDHRSDRWRKSGWARHNAGRKRAHLHCATKRTGVRCSGEGVPGWRSISRASRDRAKFGSGEVRMSTAGIVERGAGEQPPHTGRKCRGKRADSLGAKGTRFAAAARARPVNMNGPRGACGARWVADAVRSRRRCRGCEGTSVAGSFWVRSTALSPRPASGAIRRFPMSLSPHLSRQMAITHACRVVDLDRSMATTSEQLGQAHLVSYAGQVAEGRIVWGNEP